jgi:hypothetical protein
MSQKLRTTSRDTKSGMETCCSTVVEVLVSVVALFETFDGDWIGVKFPDADAAIEWEDNHFHELLVCRGRVRIVDKAEVLRMSRGD